MKPKDIFISHRLDMMVKRIRSRKLVTDEIVRSVL